MTALKELLRIAGIAAFGAILVLVVIAAADGAPGHQQRASTVIVGPR